VSCGLLFVSICIKCKTHLSCIPLCRGNYFLNYTDFLFLPKKLFGKYIYFFQYLHLLACSFNYNSDLMGQVKMIIPVSESEGSNSQELRPTTCSNFRKRKCRIALSDHFHPCKTCGGILSILPMNICVANRANFTVDTFPVIYPCPTSAQRIEWFLFLFFFGVFF